MDAVPLIRQLTVLWNDCYGLIRNFPKLDKHLLGARLLDDCDTCLLATLLALSDPSRRSCHLIEVSAAFDRFKLKLRIAVKRGLLSERWYANEMPTIAGIGRMIGAWKKKSMRERERVIAKPPMVNGGFACSTSVEREERRRLFAFAFPGAFRFRFSSSEFQFAFTDGSSGNRVPAPPFGGSFRSQPGRPAVWEPTCACAREESGETLVECIGDARTACIVARNTGRHRITIVSESKPNPKSKSKIWV